MLRIHRSAGCGTGAACEAQRRPARWARSIIFTTAALAAVVPARAQTAFTYQGRLTSGGTAANGAYDFQFRLFDAPTGGSQQGPTLVFDGLGGDPPPITVSGGLFTAALDFGGQFQGAARWLEIAVRPHGVGGYATLSPRQPLTATPYALGLIPGALISGPGNPQTVKIQNPSANGIALTAEADVGAGAWGVNGFSSQGQGVHGASDSGVGVAGSSTTGFAGRFDGLVYVNGKVGINKTSPIGLLHTDGTNGYIILGTSTTGTAVAGFASNGGFGVYGSSNSGIAVEGDSVSDVGVRGTSSGYEGVLGNGALAGVVGGSDTGIGVSGGSNTGDGVKGDSGTAPGVHGINDGSTVVSSAGVVGECPATNGNGVAGFADSGAFAYAIYGHSGQGYAAYLEGNVHVTGTLSKSGGSFKIDHPLDPANKYLLHSFVESPDMKNIYDGVVTLDTDGSATVELPEWFETLNRDFRYQLTCIGGFAPVYIAEEIQGNRFKIAGGRTGLKVSWMITGIRQDPWANAHRIPVEQDKPDPERGYYLHPELYGQTAERSTTAAKERATHTVGAQSD